MANIVVSGNLGPEFEIGTTVASKITVKVDGTSVQRDPATGSLSTPAPVYDNVAKTLQFPAVNGVPTPAIDLSSLAAEIYVDGATLDATTNILTLTDNDAGTPNVVIDLSALKGSSTDAGQVLVDGTDGKPLLTSAAVSALATETCTDAFGVNIFKAFAP